MAYDETFRRRVISYRDSGHTFTEVYEAFGVCRLTYVRWKKELEETGGFRNGCANERKRKIDKEKLRELVEKHPDWYLPQFAEVFGVWPQSIQKRLAKMGITRKKKLSPIPKKTRAKGTST